MAKNSVWQKLKTWLTGGNKSTKSSSTKSSGSKSSGSKSTASSSQPKKKKKKSEEVVERQTERFNKRELLNNVRNTTVKEEPQKQEEAKPDYKEKFKATTRTYKSMSGKDSGLADALNEKTDRLAKIRESNKQASASSANSSKKKPTVDPKRKAAEESRARLQKRLDDLKTEREEFHKATNNKYNTKTGDEEHDRKAYALRVGGYGQSSPEVQRHSVEYHPTITSAARGLASGGSFGATELAISGLSKRDKERAEAEKFYQENKDWKAEMAGEAVGALASFGKTAEITDRLGEKAIEKFAPNAAGKLAERKFIQNAAKRSVNKAVKKGLIKESSEELIKQVGKDKAEKIIRAVGTDIVQNATTGLLYDFNKASAEHEIGSADWWKEIGKSAAFNAAITGGIAGGSVLTGNKKLVRGAADTVAENIARRTAARESGKAFGEAATAERLAKERANKVASKRASGAIFGRAAAEEANLDRAILRGDAYGDIRKGVLPPSEIEINGTRNIDSPLRNASYGRERIIKNAERVEPLEATRERLLRNAEERASVGGKAKLGDLVNVRSEADARIAEINKELDEVSSAISRARNVNPQEEEELIKRFDDLMAERNALEESRRFSAPKAEPRARAEEANIAEANGVRKEPPKKGAASEENDALKAYEESRRTGYTVEITNEKGRKRKVTIEASSEKEALDLAYKRRNAKNVRIVEPATETKAKAPKLTPEEKQANMMSEADEKADAIRAALSGEEPTATAKGTKPAAEKLKTNVEAKATPPKAPTSEPKNVDELGKVIGKKREKVSAKEKVRDLAGSVKTYLLNSLDSFEQENKKFLKTDPEKWSANNAAIDKTRRYQAIAAKSIDEQQLAYNGKRIKDSKSLKEIYDGLDGEKENLFERYLLLKHAPDRIKEKKPIFKGKYENADACLEEAQKILEDNPDFADRANYLYKYIRNELQNRVDAGLLPQSVADDWFKKYPNYVPTGRVGNFSPDEDIWELAHNLAREGNSVGASKIKASTGSDLDIRSIKEQIAEATTRNWRDMTMNNLFKQMFGDKIAKDLATEADGGIEKVLDHTINLGKTKDGGKYYADVFIDGKEHRVEIEKRFYDGMKDLYRNGRFGNGFDVLADALSKLSTPFKNVITSWNPIFMVKNGARDFPEAIINSRHTKEFMECLDLARKDLYGDTVGEFTQALRDSGVSQANFVNLEEALTKERKGLLGKLGKGADKFAMLQESVETYPRLAEYMATIKSYGYDVTKKGVMDEVPMEIRDIAAANAADVTVNFGRSGSVGKWLNKGLVPFFNPSVQGFDKFVRNFSQQPSTRKMLETLAKASALGAGWTAINNLILDDNKNYQQISARDKATNAILPVPIKYENGKVSSVGWNEANVFIKIPKSRFASVYSIPTVNVANENDMGWAEMIKVAGDQVAPVNPIESNIFAPLILANWDEQGKTWYGSPIVPASMAKNLPSEQYDANTSNIGKALGKATARLPKELQISPKKADYVIDSTTGVIGDFLLPAFTPSRQGDGNALNKYVAHPAVNVLKRNFFIDSTTQNDLSTRFYDAIDNATAYKNSERGGKAEADEYKRLDAYSKEASGINQAIKHLQGSTSATRQKDIYELQNVRNQLMQDALDGKSAPSSAKTMDAVQKYVGTSYAIDNFGSSADKKAMKLYGMAKYGELSDAQMKKAIDADKSFYKGVRSIGNLEAKMEKAGFKSNTVLSKAVALASAGADDDLFGAYKATKQGRTETDNKMNRARNYFGEGGSEEEFVKLEKARKTLGKLTEYDENAEIEKAEKQLAKGEMSLAEYHSKEDEIEYNANRSYVGLATSLAQANAPERGYRLYDIKDKNIQKGINLAAMGITARDYRKMSKELDTDGNGYPSSKEIRAYVANSDIEDKATLYDALYYYKGTYNPFGTPTKYTREQAAEAGRANNVEAISDESGEIKLNPESGSSSGGYGGYYRRGYGGWHRWHRYGHGSKKKEKAYVAPKIKQSNYKASQRHYKDLASSLQTRSGSTALPTTTTKIEPPKVKFKKYEV